GLRPIGGRVVGGGVRADAVGHMLDEGGAKIAARALGRPFGDRVDRQIIVAVDAKCGNAETKPPRGERARTAPRYALEGGDRPLVVDDIEDDRGAVGRSEDKGRMEIALGGRAIAHPADGYLRVVADSRGHRPADRLDILGGEIAGYREEAVLLRGI